MVEVKYNNKPLIPTMDPGKSITIHSHNFKMPGNFTITTEDNWVLTGPQGTGTKEYKNNGTYRENVKNLSELAITVNVQGESKDLSDILSQQEELLTQLEESLSDKTSGENFFLTYDYAFSIK